jgi:hypothetical protein
MEQYEVKLVAHWLKNGVEQDEVNGCPHVI